MTNEQSRSFKELSRMLRRKGIFAWSRFATRAVMAATVLACMLVIGGHHLTESVQLFRQLWGDPLFIERGLLGLLRELSQLIIATTLVACFTGIIVCLLQIGFFISPGTLFKRQGPNRVSGVSGFGVVGLPLGILIGGWLLYRFLRDILLLLRQDASQVMSMIRLLWIEISKSVIVVALVLAILAWIVVRIRFVVLHRTARQHGVSHR